MDERSGGRVESNMKLATLPCYNILYRNPRGKRVFLYHWMKTKVGLTSRPGKRRIKDDLFIDVSRGHAVCG